MKSKNLFSLLVGILLITACSFSNVSPSPTPLVDAELTAKMPDSVKTAIPATQVQVVISTAEANSLGENKVYHDAHAGFALDYPAAWFVEDEAAQAMEGSAIYTVSLFSWDRLSYTPVPKDLNTLPDGVTKIDITVFNQDAGTLEQAVNQYKNQDTGTPIKFLKEESWTLNNGDKAIYLESEGALGLVATMISLVNGKVVYVSGYGDLISFKLIALTLRAA